MSTLHVENLKGLSSGGNANKIIVPSGQELHASGHVIQMQTAQLQGGSGSSSSTSYVDTGLSVNITPKFATSKILVFTNQSVGATKHSTTSNARIDIKLFETGSGTIIADGRYLGTDYQTSGNFSVYHNQHGVFQCSNTNQLTFKSQVRPAGGSESANAVFYGWYTGTDHNITALEIAQ
tara:strand:- start:527 stop:1063 length:537 start_codon:yes stop_codon:yes gene_type:complete